MVLLRLPSAGALHERIAAAVRRAVANGEVGIGDTLPPAREVAVTLGVNVNTVLRAYRDLRDEGVVDLRRGRGATVQSGPGRVRLLTLADALLAEANRAGLDTDEICRLIKERT